MVSRVDQIYRSILLTKFFVKGWGHPENLKRIFSFRKIISNRDTCRTLVDSDHPIHIKKEADCGDHVVLDCEFDSPFVQHLPGLLPKEAEKSHFQLMMPKVWRSQLHPTCLVLAGTGDHGFWRRRYFTSKPLLEKSGIASIILENPFYGCRKPKDQLRSALHNVSDLFVMGGCLVLESLAIFHWCERMGFGPLGITGMSMGGHMASLAATNWHKALALVPCLSWTSASAVFTQGVLSGAINWDLLKNQYFSDEVFRDELFNMIQSPEGHFGLYHEVGQHFAREFPSSLERVQSLQSEAVQGIKKIQESKTHAATDTHTQTCSLSQTSFSCDKELLQNLGSIKIHEYEDESQSLLSDKKLIPRPIVGGGGGGIFTSSASVEKLDILSTFYSAKKRFIPGANSSEKNLNSKVPLSLTSLTPVDIRPQHAIGTPRVTFDPPSRVNDPLTWEAVQFMRGVMDECTHLGNFSIPVDPSLAIIVTAENDAYIPRSGMIPLNKIWPGSELRTIKTGHISAFLFNREEFRKAITDSFDRLTQKYYS